MQTLEKDLDNYDATIYTDGAATHGNANGGTGTIVTTGPQSDHRVLRQCTIPAGKWCSTFQAEEKAARTALKLVQEDVSLQMVRISSNSMSILQGIQNRHPSHQVANSGENEILDALTLLTNRGCNLSLIRCPSHSGIRSNELADLAAKNGTTVEQEGELSDSAKVAIRQASTQDATRRLRFVVYVAGWLHYMMIPGR